MHARPAPIVEEELRGRGRERPAGEGLGDVRHARLDRRSRGREKLGGGGAVDLDAWPHQQREGFLEDPLEKRRVEERESRPHRALSLAADERLRERHRSHRVLPVTVRADLLRP